MVIQIEILSEHEIPTGWVFDAHFLAESGNLQPITLTLSWADYNLWSPDGTDEPQKIAEAVLSYLAAKTPLVDIRSKLDASHLRRMFDDADETIPNYIQKSF